MSRNLALIQPQHKENNISSNNIPDMYQVLLRFGIDPTNFVTLPLNNYHWWEFYTEDQSMSPIHSQDSLTISQRVKSMVRRARLKSDRVGSHQHFKQ